MTLLSVSGCTRTPKPDEPASAKVVQGGSYVVGCRIQGCGYGAYCNAQGYCEERECSKGCPEGTTCNEGLNRCQSPPPPRQKGDRLPTDDKTQTLPTMH